MKYTQLKNSGWFTFTWVILTVYSTVIIFYNIQVGILGFIIAILFGFLGFDMMGTVARNLGGKKK